MKQTIEWALLRAVRVLFSMILAGLAIYATGDARLAILVPIFSGIGKYLRDEYKFKYIPI